MKKWQMSICVVVVLLWPGKDASPNTVSFLPGKSVISIIPEFFGQSGTESTVSSRTEPGSSTSVESTDDIQFVTSEEINADSRHMIYDTGPEAVDKFYPVQHASLPQGLAVYPLPLEGSDHELMFNVSWQPPTSSPARDYSLEVRSVTDTIDCNTPMCYEYNIPGEVQWYVIPANPNPVAETCAVRPGCAYRVRLIAHPWDGHTSANLHVELDECVAGVCSCGHAPRLPAPRVKARVVSIQGEIFANISWVLPTPLYPNRLPPGLNKKNYIVSIGKQMVSDAYPAPWFANTISRKVDADGPIFDGDSVRWLLLPITERSVERGVERRVKPTRNLVLDVKLLARVSVIDDRGCVGPAGNATAYDPAEANKTSVGTYALWAAFGGICVIAMGAMLAVSARAVKCVLNAFRPAPVSAPIDPLCGRPAWFPLHWRQPSQALMNSLTLSHGSEGCFN